MSMRRWMGMAALSAAMLTGQELVVDRGLPRVNQNNEAGAAARSNIRWTLYNQGFAGDDFTIGKAGEKWVIQTVRVWTVPGAYESDPATLGDVYQDVRLYVGGPDENLSPVVTGRLKRGSNAVEGADIAITEAADAPRYENFGAELKIYQGEFRNVKLVVDGGVRYRFGAWGLGRVIGEKGEVYPWFTHGSNAVQGETPVYGTDGKLLLFDTAGRYAREFDPAGAAWNKGSDLNVQIWADRQ